MLQCTSLLEYLLPILTEKNINNLYEISLKIKIPTRKHFSQQFSPENGSEMTKCKNVSKCKIYSIFMINISKQQQSEHK